MQNAQAGTLESSDIMITISPGLPGSGVNIDLDSIVLSQYGQAIQQTIEETLNYQGITDICVKAVDRGALECTIKARILAALIRSGQSLKEGSV